MSLRALVLVALCAAGLAAPAGAAAKARYAPAATATIHPGVMTYTAGAQCTANFLFTDAAGDLLLGQAAHCAGTGGSTETDGCTSGSLPLGTPVQLGGSRPGTLVYSSWLAMQAAGEKDPDTCAFNDLALVRIDPADAAKVNPSVPFFGGPVGLASGTPKVLSTVLSFGNSSLRQGIAQLGPKQGLVVQNDGGGWSHTVYTVTPGVPGDSGSGFLDASGRALGVLSTLALAPLPLSNGVGDLPRELAYASAHAGLGTLRLVPGTEPFRGPLADAALAHARTALRTSSAPLARVLARLRR